MRNKVIDALLTALVFSAAGVGYLKGYRDGKAAVIQAPKIEVLAGQNYHDAAWSSSITGMLALGVVGLDYPALVSTNGDMAVLRVDRQSGRVLAKCEKDE